MKDDTHGAVRSHKHTGAARTPHRVAARLEGVVKNAGIKPHKKAPK